MLQNGSKVTMVDNSGVSLVRVFWVRAGKRKTGSVGDVRVGSVQAVSKGADSSKRGEVVRVLMVRTRGPVRQPNGGTLTFDDNAGMLVTQVGRNWSPVGTRMEGPVSQILRLRGHRQAVSRADRVL